MRIETVFFLSLVPSLIEGIGYDTLADFVFDIFYRLLFSFNIIGSSSSSSLSSSNAADADADKSNSDKRNLKSEQIVNERLKGNFKFHNVLGVLRQERSVLQGTSAQDEFAKWAKQKRLVDGLEEKANNLLKGYRFRKLAFSYPATWVLKALVWGLTSYVCLIHRSSLLQHQQFVVQEAFQLSPRFKNFALETFLFDLFQFILAFPFGPSGSISVVSIFLLFRIALHRLTLDFIKPPIAAYVSIQNIP